MDYTCPKCGKVIPSASSLEDGKKQINAAFFPFCSERCRMVDLGAWLDGNYHIVSEDQSSKDDREY